MMRLMTVVALLLAFAPVVYAQNVAVVDVEKCLSEFNKAKEQRAQLKAEIDEKLRGMQEEKRRIEAMKQNSDLYVEGSQEHIDIQKRIHMGMAALEIDGKAFEIQYARKLAEAIAGWYADVKREIKAVAEAKGIKVVFMYVESLPKGRTETDVTNNIMVRSVVHFDPSVDITAEVVSRLNK